MDLGVTSAPPGPWGGIAAGDSPWTASSDIPPAPPPLSTGSGTTSPATYPGSEPTEPPRLRWPAVLRTAQVVPARRAIAAAVAVMVATAAITALVISRQRPRASPVAAPPIVTSGTAISATASSTAPTAARATEIVVAVVGRVRRPGLLTLPTGARVDDALRKAGGVLPGVDTTSLNLARVLHDGEQITVGGTAAPAAPSATPVLGGSDDETTAGPVNLNAATAADLDALPGVGPVIAQRIVDYRAQHGMFTSVDQLGDVAGIGDSTLERLRPLVTI
jgi:competence protein ComEA